MTLDLVSLRSRRFLFRLHLTGPVRFGFFHGGALRGLLSKALEQHELPPGLLPVACETGRVRFEAGMAYHLELTLVGQAASEPESWAERLEQGLHRLSRPSRRPRDAGGAPSPGPPARMESNFRLESVEDLPAPDLAA